MRVIRVSVAVLRAGPATGAAPVVPALSAAFLRPVAGYTGSCARSPVGGDVPVGHARFENIIVIGKVGGERGTIRGWVYRTRAHQLVQRVTPALDLRAPRDLRIAAVAHLGCAHRRRWHPRAARVSCPRLGRGSREHDAPSCSLAASNRVLAQARRHNGIQLSIMIRSPVQYFMFLLGVDELAETTLDRRAFAQDCFPEESFDGLIAFADTMDGDLCMFDCSQARDGLVPVLLSDHEDDPDGWRETVIADDFDQWYRNVLLYVAEHGEHDDFRYWLAAD